jgi:peptidyl-prolyl cis-trans isomerase C
MSPEIEAYALLRAALSLFGKPPFELDAQQKNRALHQAHKEYAIESRVLSSLEASGVVIGEQELTRALAEVRAQFDDSEVFLQALQMNDLDETGLRYALARQCKVNAVMELVAARAPQVSEVEIGIYYHSHPEKFRKPEQRRARHILISINDDYPENTRAAAQQRIEEIWQQLQRKPHKFADLALKHSECPTALQGGVLGLVTPGTLYPQLDTVLFRLKLDEISRPLESEIGFHLVQCQKIIPASTLSLKNASPKIKALMQERARRNCQRSWIAGLPKTQVQPS